MVVTPPTLDAIQDGVLRLKRLGFTQDMLLHPAIMKGFCAWNFVVVSVDQRNKPPKFEVFTPKYGARKAFRYLLQ